MSLEQALNENTAAINALIAALKSAPAITVAAPAAEPAKENKAGKSVQKQEPAANTQPTATEAEEDAASNKQSNSDTTHNVDVNAAKPPVEIPYKDVADLVVSLIKAKGKPVAVELLQEYGADNLKAVDPSKYAELMERARALIGG